MRNAKSFEEFEDGWRDFLTALEKVWLKAERECQVVKAQFEPWQRTYRDARRADPLLRYLFHARNADTHTIQDIVDHSPPAIGLGPSRGGVWHINKLEIRNGQLVHYSGNQPMRVTFIPGRLQLLPVVDRGVTYAPPEAHRGKPLPSADPLAVANLGLEYYRAFLEEAERKFFRAGPPPA